MLIFFLFNLLISLYDSFPLLENFNEIINNFNIGFKLNFDFFTIFIYFFFSWFLVCFLFACFDFYFLKENARIEIPMLLFLVFTSGLFLISSNELIEIFILLECITFSAYVLVGFEKKNKLSSISGIRYLIIGSIPSSFLILGFCFFYQDFGSLFRDNIEINLNTFFSLENLTQNFLENATLHDLSNESNSEALKFVNSKTLNKENYSENFDWISSLEIEELPWTKLAFFESYKPATFLKDISPVLNEDIILVLSGKPLFLEPEYNERVHSLELFNMHNKLHGKKTLPDLLTEFIDRQERNEDAQINWRPELNTVKGFINLIPANSLEFKNISSDSGEYPKYLSIPFADLSENEEAFANYYSLICNLVINKQVIHIEEYESFKEVKEKFLPNNINFEQLNSYKNLEEIVTKQKETSNTKKEFIESSIFGGFININEDEIWNFINSSFNFYFFQDNINILAQLGLLLILINFLFKVTAAPFHVWAPTIYHGTSTSIVFFLTSFIKIIMFSFFILIFSTTFYTMKYIWGLVILISSVLSFIVGMLGAFSEKYLKKFIIYSSIGHVGFLLMGLPFFLLEGSSITINYLIVYVLSSIIFWYGILLIKERLRFITDLRFLIWSDFFLRLIFSLNIFSLSGLPPLAGFFVKFDIFYHIISSSNFIFAAFVFFMTVINFFYYLRLIKIMHFENFSYEKQYFKYDSIKLFLISFFIHILLLIPFMFDSKIWGLVFENLNSIF